MRACRTSTTPGTARPPGTNPGVIGHAKIVQDRQRATVFDRWHGHRQDVNAAEPIRFDTKIAVLLRDDLEVWQRLNVTAFLVSGIGQRSPEVIGEPYADADGTEYLPMFRQPVLVFEGGKETLAQASRAGASAGVSPCRSSPRTSSRPATTGTTGPPCAPCAAPTWTWPAWPFTARATPSTRSSRARGCTRRRSTVLYYM